MSEPAVLVNKKGEPTKSMLNTNDTMDDLDIDFFTEDQPEEVDNDDDPDFTDEEEESEESSDFEPLVKKQKSAPEKPKPQPPVVDQPTAARKLKTKPLVADGLSDESNDEPLSNAFKAVERSAVSDIKNPEAKKRKLVYAAASHDVSMSKMEKAKSTMLMSASATTEDKKKPNNSAVTMHALFVELDKISRDAADRKAEIERTFARNLHKQLRLHADQTERKQRTIHQTIVEVARIENEKK